MLNNSRMKYNNEQLHLLAGIITWTVVFSISVMQLQNSSFLIEAIVLQLAILMTLAVTVNGQHSELSHKRNLIALLLMLGLIFLLAWRVRVDYFFIYSIMWISIAVNYFTYRASWAWLVLIVLTWYLTKAHIWNDQYPFFETLLEGTFHIFALMSSMVALQSKLANQKTQVLNRELVATQNLLAQASKESERTRIARDLHDLLGHHLTALTINLQVASRLSQGEVKDKVDQCHGLSKLLLNDVRDAVTTLREAPAVDLRELVTLAIEDIPRLVIKLEIDETLRVNDVKMAETVLRCIQEAITNSLKHSRANNMSIRLHEVDGKLSLNIIDDGQDAQRFELGNGLTGMRERVDLFNGEVSISNTAGFQIEVLIPLEST